MVSTMSVAQDPAPAVRRKRDIPPGVFLVLGVVVAPALLLLAGPHGAAPNTEAFVRLAFAAVAGQTIAIATVCAVLVAAIIRRSPARRLLTFAIIAAVVTWVALNSINSYAEQLGRALAS